MLQVGIHHSQEIGIRVTPAVNHCASQSLLVLAYQELDARVAVGAG